MSGPIVDIDGLLNLWAIDANDEVISARACAVKVRYRCANPGCTQTLRVVCAESNTRTHLRHDVTCTGSGESYEHDLAKRIVAQRLDGWINGRFSPPFIGHQCLTCGTVLDVFLCGKATAVEVEGAIGTRRADVLVLNGEAPLFAIEILHSHAVDDAKVHDLAALDVPWIELSAAVVLAESAWIYTRGSVPAPACPVCQRAERIADAARRETEAQARAIQSSVAATNKARELADVQRTLSFARDRVTVANKDEALARRRAVQANVDATAMVALAAQRVATATRAVAELGRCPRCGIRVPPGSSPDRHRINFGELAPRERDNVRAAHPDWAKWDTRGIEA